MGRTGTMWRCEYEGVTPDIMTFGKAFGGGVMPITGIICRPPMWTQELVDNPWLLGSPTFGGNPVCCSAAIATIKYMVDHDIPGQCKAKGEILKKCMFARGVITAGTLVNAKCIRFEPAAVITEEQIKAVIERLDSALADTKKEFNL